MKKNILLVYFNDRPSGSVVYTTEQTVKSLAKDFNLYTFFRSDSLVSNLSDYIIKNKKRKLQEIAEPINFVFAFIKALYFLIFNRISLVYVFDFVYWKPAELYAAKFLKIPVIAYFTLGKESGVIKGYCKDLDLAISISEVTSDTLTTLPSSKKKIVNNFIDLTRFSVKEAPDSRETLTFGCVAYLNEMKGIDILIHSLARLNEQSKKFKVLIAGKEKLSGYQKSLEDLAKSLNVSNLEFVGEISDVNNFLQKLDIFILPSRNEGMPHVILEAAAVGLPIISTTVGGIPEMMAKLECGVLVTSEDDAALADAIDQMINNKLIRKQYAINARENVENYFTNHKSVEAIKELIHQNINAK